MSSSKTQRSDTGEARTCDPLSRVKHSTTEPLRPIYCTDCIKLLYIYPLYSDGFSHTLPNLYSKGSEVEVSK